MCNSPLSRWALEVVVSGEVLGITPFGFRDVEVGEYTAIFKLDGAEIEGQFFIMAEQTEKVVVDFAKQSLFSKNATATAKPAFGTKIEGAQGSTNTKELVIALQKALVDNGCRAGTADGIFGRKSSAAIDKFNAQRGDKCEALMPTPPVGKGAFPSNENLSVNLARLGACGVQVCSYAKTTSARDGLRTLQSARNYIEAGSFEAARQKILILKLKGYPKLMGEALVRYAVATGDWDYAYKKSKHNPRLIEVIALSRRTTDPIRAYTLVYSKRLN